ncbi:rhomboid family intramembrane serine protease [Hoyosella sp. YIM 151337]|uniref:rhomboid family intramembrane serine protease n=1 Tax=Hoyosella sp. YIM 151337 TaxID=2992742 RepID=UPI002236565B|nr:rhomboid family intramembrane serine protease [Hoyosella sp. YIM 151337]MCW4354773.1 rhomboid family intramembrane serine protease [Hoyosella sp. YIM 151337]
MSHPGRGGGPVPQPGCVRHPDRPTGLQCNRCHRPYCPECLREAPVGYQCVNCVAEAARTVPRARTIAGAPMPTREQRPVVTYALIAVNILVYAITVAQSGNLMANYRGSSIFEMFALFPPLVAAGEYERLVGSGFLHYGSVHLLVNMFALFIVGREVEFVLGRGRYLAVYAIALLSGSAAVMWMQVEAVTAGASGAVFGLFGALAVILTRLRQNPTGILVIIGLNVFISVTIPAISLWGHMGGLVAGAVSAAALLYLPKVVASGKQTTAQRASRLGLIGLVVVTVAVLASIAVRVVVLREALWGL